LEFATTLLLFRTNENRVGIYITVLKNGTNSIFEDVLQKRIFKS